MIKVLENLEANRKTLIVMDEVNENVTLSARNIPGVKVIDSKGLNVYDILDCTKLVITEGAIKAVEGGIGIMAHITDVLKKPVLTEKSLMLQQAENKYTFDVEITANKTEVKQAVEKMFDVKLKV